MSSQAVKAGRHGRPSVLIVDQHEVSRAALTALLRTEGVQVLASVASGCDAIAAIAEGSPDIAVVDVTPGDRRPLDTVHRLQALSPGPTVVLTSSTDRSKLCLPSERVRFLAKADICADSLLRASGWLSDSRQSE
jgi:two-component system response regulator EvgA